MKIVDTIVSKTEKMVDGVKLKADKADSKLCKMKVSASIKKDMACGFIRSRFLR